MIGQVNLIERMGKLIEDKKFPRFSIIVGEEGSGKKTLASLIGCKIGKYNRVHMCETGVDAMRSMISACYKNPDECVYIIPDADKMSPSAKNSILKVTEEPPQNAYFIMTATSLSNVLPTIQSRGTVFNMERYSSKEIGEYLDSKDKEFSKTEREILLNVCVVPGEVDIMEQTGIVDFYDYVKKVYDNIGQVSVTNAFKIPGKVKLKETGDGYDLALFWKIFVAICLEDFAKSPLLSASIVTTTCKKLQALKITGVNKQMLMSSWIIDVRKCFT